MTSEPSTSAVRDELADLRAENRRLRTLVGPNEQSYADLKAELAGASEAVRVAEEANGELRSRMLELNDALDQVRHNLGTFKRLLYQRSRRALAKGTRPLRRWWNGRRAQTA